jgi:hypothetical protein
MWVFVIALNSPCNWIVGATKGEHFQASHNADFSIFLCADYENVLALTIFSGKLHL